MFKRLVIVTGMSGAGKSTALKILEDAGYYCVDNLPIPLIETFCELIMRNEDEKMSRAAIGIDIRSGSKINGADEVFAKMRSEEIPFEILFMDASDTVLINRFKETRRFHPLAGKDGSIKAGIKQERKTIEFLKKESDYILDTSSMLARDTKKKITDIFVNDKKFGNLMIIIRSFGFKFGIPTDSDLVFDVRFLPNPYYIEELKRLSGNDLPVSDYVMSFEESRVFRDKLTDMISYMIPYYIKEGKNQLVISIGCTGGRHRSVTFANELYRELEKCDEYGVRLEHRDIDKDKKIKEFE